MQECVEKEPARQQRGGKSWVGPALWLYGGLLAAVGTWVGLTPAVLPLPGLDDPTGLGWRAALGVGAGLLAAAISRAWVRWSESARRSAELLSELLGPLGAGTAWLLALLSGVAEEALFRGLLQPALGFWAASLLFGAAHWTPLRELRSWTLSTLVAGLCLGALFAGTGDLLAPTLMHVVVNGLNLRWLGERRSSD